MINIFCIRPRGHNVGNEAIFLGLRVLLREAFGPLVNLISVPATASHDGDAFAGLSRRAVHEINQYGHGVVVGGGNLYENGELDVDLGALPQLRPPLMLFSLSRGRIYDHRGELADRTDVMPDAVIDALHRTAVLSLARDGATLEHLHRLGLDRARLGGCPSLLVGRSMPTGSRADGGEVGLLVSVRHPQLMNVMPALQARVHDDVLGLVAMLQGRSSGPVRLLCHDRRDLLFAASLGGVDYLYPSDVQSYLALLRDAEAVITYRLHSFLPSLALGTPAVNISYDERAQSLVETVGLGSWDIDMVRDEVVAAAADRLARIDDLNGMVEAARGTWGMLESVMADAFGEFADHVAGYQQQWHT